MTYPSDNTLVARLREAAKRAKAAVDHDQHEGLTVEFAQMAQYRIDEAATALEASYAENERLTTTLEAVERERQLMAKDWGRFCESMGVQFDAQEAVACDLQAQFSTLYEALATTRPCVLGYIDRCDFTVGNNVLAPLDAALNSKASP